MFIHVHVKTITAAAPGEVLAHVACEKCSTKFHYRLARNGIGQAASLYGMFKAATQRRAQKAAQKNLAKRLDREVELVPCPSCHWVNQSALRIYRKSRYPEPGQIAFIFLIATAIVGSVLYFAAPHFNNHPPSHRAPELLITLAIGLGLTAISLAIQYFLRSRINPNKNLINGLPTLPPGTPPALTFDQNGQLTRAPGDPTTPPTDPTWGIFRPAQIRWEPLCCQCLKPSTRRFKLPFSTSLVIPVPLCLSCYKQIFRQFCFRNLAALPIAVGLAWIVSQLPRHFAPEGRITILCFLSFAFWVFSFAIIERFLKPFRYRVLDKTRGIFKLGFKNPAYTALLIRKAAQADGLY